MTSRSPFIWMLITGLSSFSSAASAQPDPTSRSCDPPLIDSVITNGPLCPGDQIILSVVASGDILGYSWEGPGTGTFFTFTPDYTFNFQVLGEYTMVVYGDCGNDTAIVTMTAQGAGAGQSGFLQLCDNSPLKSLGMSLGPHAEGGAWTYYNEPHSGMYDPAVDAPGEYVYTAPSLATCPGTSQTATITVEETNVGPNMAWSTCSMDSAFDLGQILAQGATPGGAWSRYVFLSLVPHSGIYEPDVDSSGVFQYTVAGCHASVSITELQASQWFEDADNDSLGDPTAMIWSCIQPPGFVADSTDDCNAIAGRIGSACDDGLSYTHEDVITDSCTCTGSFSTAIRSIQETPLPFSMWPNPNNGVQLNLRSSEPGPGEVRIHDALGRLEMVLPIELANGPVSIPLEGRLSAGIHMVHFTANGRSGTLRLIVH